MSVAEESKVLNLQENSHVLTNPDFIKKRDLGGFSFMAAVYHDNAVVSNMMNTTADFNRG